MCDLVQKLRRWVYNIEMSLGAEPNFGRVRGGDNCCFSRTRSPLSKTYRLSFVINWLNKLSGQKFLIYLEIFWLIYNFAVILNLALTSYSSI